MGAYPIGAFLPTTTQQMLAGVYRIPRIASRGRSVVTNTTPVAAYRGAGRPEAAALVERAMDLIAAELGMDPVDVRRKNLIPAEVFPYRTASGHDVRHRGLRARARRGAEAWRTCTKLRAEQAARRERGDHLLLGIGVSTYVEITAFASKEFGSVRGATPTARVTVLDRHVAAGTGPRDGVRADRLGGPGRAVRGGAGRPLGHGGRAPRRGHVGVAVAAGRRLGGRRAERRRSSRRPGRSRRTCSRSTRRISRNSHDGRIEVAGAPERALTWAELAAAADDPRGCLRA